MDIERALSGPEGRRLGGIESVSCVAQGIQPWVLARARSEAQGANEE